MTASLGDRIKRYELAGNHQMPPRQPLVIRVDGRAFHTYTRGMDRPFDKNLMGAMRYSMEKTANQMQGFKLAYTQSDEATFLITDYDNLDTQGWFDYDLSKVVSLSASIFTAAFNRWMWDDRGSPFDFPDAHFDSRAFTVPMDDVPNVFVWRQRDWERNSVSMLARANFSHKQLVGKKIPDMHDMLHEKGINWAHLPEDEKNGTFLLRDGSLLHEKADYAKVKEWIEAAKPE